MVYECVLMTHDDYELEVALVQLLQTRPFKAIARDRSLSERCRKSASLVSFDLLWPAHLQKPTAVFSRKVMNMEYAGTVFFVYD